MSSTIGQLKKNSGQATIEYILLIVIILALILGPLKQFSQAFNAYIDALFGKGNYIACLLETGELGGQSSDPNSSCLASLNANIKTALGGGGGGGGGDKGSGENDANKDGGAQNGSGGGAGSKGAKKPQTQAANSSSGSSDVGGGRGAGETVGVNGGGQAGGQYRKASQRVVGKAGSSSEKNDSGDSYVKVGEQYDYKDLKPKNGFEVSLKRLDGRFSLESEEAKREEKLAPKEVASTNSRNLRAKEVNIDPSRGPATKEIEISSDGFGFSMLLKWFLIACILIALVIFVGGQAMQISKGGDN